ncbi:MAG: metal-dependent transcriptional regulator [Clostridia bacterium]|nr:metal-dependent transcriptional regulator [Clostridia bacterium]
MKIQESEEMYLETIYILKMRSGDVRAVDVAAELNYSRPSVSRAMGLLKDKGYITIDESRGINLTEEGKKRAKAVYEKHEVITKLFIKMGASEPLAEENACRIEHVISDEMFEVLKKFSEKS